MTPDPWTEPAGTSRPRGGGAGRASAPAVPPSPAQDPAGTADLSARIIPAGEWRALRDAHVAAVEERTAAHLERRARGEKHPVEDFLYTYYPFSPGQLSRWDPGAGCAAVVESDEDAAAFDRRWYRIVDAPESGAVPGPAPSRSRPTAETGSSPSGTRLAVLDAEAWLADRGSGARFIRDLLTRTLAREGTFGCFGLHEWAMVYRQTDDEHRHRQVPLRLTQEETDAVVEGHRIRCSHFDAFRFFTPEVRPRNELQPTRETMREMEQPGCLHGGMDLYKWAMKLAPVVPSSVVLAAFDLARDIRTLDMEASPYDVRAWGYGAVPIETPAGKAEYVRRQRAFAERGNALRREIITSLDVVLD